MSWNEVKVDFSLFSNCEDATVPDKRFKDCSLFPSFWAVIGIGYIQCHLRWAAVEYPMWWRFPFRVTWNGLHNFHMPHLTEASTTGTVSVMKSPWSAAAVLKPPSFFKQLKCSLKFCLLLLFGDCESLKDAQSQVECSLLLTVPNQFIKVLPVPLVQHLCYCDIISANLRREWDLECKMIVSGFAANTWTSREFISVSPDYLWR